MLEKNVCRKVKLSEKDVRKLNCLKTKQNQQKLNFQNENIELPGKGQYRLKLGCQT